MKRWHLTLLAAAMAAGLAACDQRSTTTVIPPTASLPEDTARNAPASAPAAAAPAGDAAIAAASSPAADVAAATPPLADASAAPAPMAGASAGQVQAMGAPAATSASTGGEAAAGAPAWADVPAGTAAPTEVSRFFEAQAGRKDKAAASGSAPASPAAQAQPAASASGKVSLQLPAVKDPGDAQGAQLLAQHALQVPVAGIQPARLADNFEQSRGQRKHEAMDILAPAGTPVVAVDDGRIAKLFTSKPGGLTVYQFDNASRLAYYYAHLQGYAPGLREGMAVRRGELIGYVGSTGNADAKTPHLHFAVFRLGDPPKWWQGEAVNPYPALSRAQVTDNVASR